MNRVVLATVPMLLATATGGCSVVLAPGESQCQTTKDCEARGFSGAVCTAGVCEKAPVVKVDPVWGCLGHVVEPTPDVTKTVEFPIRLAFASDETPVTDATVDICNKLDLGCTAMGDPNFAKGLMPDADGNVTVTVIQGFDGFVRVTAPDIVDSRVFVGRPILAPPTVKEVRFLRPSEYQILVAFAMQTQDMTRGTAILLAEDCQGLAASGVRFTCPYADAQSAEFYLINQEPKTPPTATSTDVDGFGGFLNLPVSSAVAQSYRVAGDVLIGQSSFDVLANTISYVLISPTPK